MATTVKVKKAPKKLNSTTADTTLEKKIRKQIIEKAEDGCPFC